MVSATIILISASWQAKNAKKPVVAPLPTPAELSQQLTQTLTLASMQQPEFKSEADAKAFLKQVAIKLTSIADNATLGETKSGSLDLKAEYALIKFEANVNATQDPIQSAKWALALSEKYRESKSICKPMEELIFHRYLNEKGISELKATVIQSKNSEVLSSWLLTESIYAFLNDKADINDLKFLHKNYPDTIAGKRALKMYEFRSKMSLNLPMPDFEIELMNGQKGKLSQLKGKMVMIHFWGFWNLQSMDEVSQLRALEKNYAKDLVIIGVNTDPWTRGFLETKMKEAGINWSNHFASRPSGQIPIDLGIKEYPSKIILDRQGIVRYLPGMGSWRDVLMKNL